MIKKVIKKLINIIFNIFPIDNNKVVFTTGNGRFEGHPKAIYQFFEKTKEKDFKYFFILKKNADTSMLNKNTYYFYNTIKMSSYFIDRKILNSHTFN